jgi:transcriptional regulator with XRE-family HTH domain
MAKRRKGGHPTVFTPAQNRALRSLLKEVSERFRSQQDLGSALGTTQQSVSNLLTSKNAGLGYLTATALVRLAGHTGVDAFFTTRGLTPESSPALEDCSLHARAS